ncbi:MAG: hypothetical protein LBL39_00710 [Planctomycetaceae bacterium]|jgi:hypothetical protein|nr:hypothetical protein [Planctomycetaceae bacterium]
MTTFVPNVLFVPSVPLKNLNPSGNRRKRFFVFRRLSAAADNDILRSGDFRRLPKTIYFVLLPNTLFLLLDTFGCCRQRFFLFWRISAAADNDIFCSGNFRRLPEAIFFF